MQSKPPPKKALVGESGKEAHAEREPLHLNVLNGLQHSQRLVDRAPEAEVVDRRVLHDPLLVDDEEPPEGDARIGQHPVAMRDGLLEVGNQGVLQVAHAAGLAVGLDPRQVGELGVNGHAEDLGGKGGDKERHGDMGVGRSVRAEGMDEGGREKSRGNSPE